MQKGLHIGLAAWINEQEKNDHFFVCPSTPQPINLVNLEGIQDVHDLAQAAEFARLTNFIPRQGRAADIYDASSILWRTHRNVLARMDFASEPWTSTEQAAYEAAKKILYIIEADQLPKLSNKYILYLEMKNIYQDLVSSEGSPEDIQLALSNWMVIGHKQEVENALETISRLSHRSSILNAENTKFALSEDPPGHGLRLFGDLPFAPVYFAPISAINRATWMEAKISFDDIDQIMKSNPLKNQWRAFRTNRSGEIRFDYIALKCIRPWFDPLIYQADDWRYDDEGVSVSKGNGVDGLLPAYVSTIYLAGLKELNTNSEPKREYTPPNTSVISNQINIANINNAFRAKNIGDQFVPSSGVVNRSANKTLSLNRSSVNRFRLISNQVSRPQIQLNELRYNKLNAGYIRQLTTRDSNLRISIAQAILGQRTNTPQQDNEPINTSVFVAGFGCEKIPFAPNPNPTYTW